MFRAGMIDPKNRCSFPLDCATPRPIPKHHEIVRRVNALFRVRLQLSVVAASRSTSEDE
jgi:hypothetical protein